MGERVLMNFPQQIDDLKSTSDPDTMFLQMMISHHAMAIAQADSQMRDGSNQSLMAISENIVGSRARQIGDSARHSFQCRLCRAFQESNLKHGLRLVPSLRSGCQTLYI